MNMHYIVAGSLGGWLLLWGDPLAAAALIGYAVIYSWSQTS